MMAEGHNTLRRRICSGHAARAARTAMSANAAAAVRELTDQSGISKNCCPRLKMKVVTWPAGASQVKSPPRKTAMATIARGRLGETGAMAGASGTAVMAALIRSIPSRGTSLRMNHPVSGRLPARVLEPR